MTMGFQGTNGVRTSSEKDCQEILDIFFSHGHTELDTARVYAEGTTEQVGTLTRRTSDPGANRMVFTFTPGLGQAQFEECDDRHQVRRMISCCGRGHVLIFWCRVYPVTPGDHSPPTLRSIFLTSLRSLKRDKVRVLYLHAPDRSVPFEDTVREINKLYTEGRL